ncbi:MULTISPECIES: hypothetical protein [unclassified Blastococcus]
MANNPTGQDPDRRPHGWRLREPRFMSLGNLLLPSYEEALASDPNATPAKAVADAIGNTLAGELEWFLSESRRGQR